MKLLYLNNFNYLRGGSEKVMLEEMKHLRGCGHHVDVFSRRNSKNESSRYQDSFPSEMETQNIRPSLESLAVVKEIIYSHHSRRGLKEVILDYMPDIAHAHNIYGRLSTSVLDELKSQKIPVVLTLHDMKLLCPSYLMLNKGKVCEECKGGKYHRAILNKCHKGSTIASAIYAFESWFNHFLKKYDSVKYFISPSRFLRDKCIEFGWPEQRIVHVPNFVDAKSFKLNEQPGSYLLYLGRLSREKGLKTLLSAMDGLGWNSRLVVVGDGPERENLESIAQQSNLNVRFTGYLSGADLEQAILGAKAVVMPSEWYENAPLSLLESFAYGKPVIGARIGGIPEMIDDGVNGFLFESGNVEELRERVRLLHSMSDAQLLSMGNAAREKVEKEYSVEAHLEKLLHVYSLALGRQCA